jgi:hypothetical protein
MSDDYIDQVQRKLEFLAKHPEWSMTFVRSAGYHEAVREDESGVTVLTSYRLQDILGKVERLIESEESE